MKKNIALLLAALTAASLVTSASAYDLTDHPSKVVFTDENVTYTDELTYDAAGNMIRDHYFDSEGYNFTTEYTYDSRGNRLSVQSSYPDSTNNYTKTFTYNELDQCIMSVYRSETGESYSDFSVYDSHGNVLSTTYVGSGGVTYMHRHIYTYDSAGNITRDIMVDKNDTVEYDTRYTLFADGKPYMIQNADETGAIFMTDTYSYNNRGDVVSIITVEGGNTRTEFHSYTYDANGRIKTDTQTLTGNFDSLSDYLTATTTYFYPQAAKPVVVLSNQNLMVNGQIITCEKYNIDGANYFKLRDLALLLNKTGSQFAVGYDSATNSVTITKGRNYIPNGTELIIGADNSATAVSSPQKIYINGTAVTNLSVYNIGGNNYFKLRDLGTAIGFGVDYNDSTRTAIVTTF